MAVATYYAEHGHYPPAYLVDAEGRAAHSWRVLLLPYLGQEQLYHEYSFAEPWDGPNNRQLASRMPRAYAFQGEEHPGNTTTNYLAVVGPETVWPGASTVSSEAVKDGLGTTILLVENRGAGIPWMEPRDLSFAEMSLAVNSPKGVSSKYLDPAVVMLDGSLYRLRQDLSPATLRALLTISGGERVQADGSGGWQWLPDGRQRALAGP